MHTTRVNNWFVAWWCNEQWGEVSDVFEGHPLAAKWVTWKLGSENMEDWKIRGFMTQREAEQYKKYGDNI